MDVWIIWLVAAFLLGAGEMHARGLFLAPLATGALLAAGASLAGAGVAVSVVLFLCLSIVALRTLRPLALRHQIIGVVVLFSLFVAARTIRIIPQARAGVVERLGRYHRTLDPGLAVVSPFVDRVRPLVDLREQVVNFKPQSVITEDNVVVGIETVLYFTVTEPRSATYETALGAAVVAIGVKATWRQLHAYRVRA